MLKALIAAGLTAGLIGSANAQPAGAPMAAPMQTGGWGQQGWQPGGAPTMQPPMSQPMPPQDQAMMPQGGMMHHPGPDRGARWHGDYRRAERGGRLKGPWLEPGYTVQDWRGWGLAPPGPGMRWVRYYDDAVLIDPSGMVVDTRYGIDWDAPRAAGRWTQGGPGGWHHGAPGGYGQPGYAPGGYGQPYGTTTYRAGPNTIVTTQTVPTPVPTIYGGGYDGYGYGGATVVTTPGTITTTTTTSYERVSGWAPSHRRHVRRRCACRK